MISAIILLVLGIVMNIVSSVLWSQKYGNQYIDINLIPLRKKYRLHSVLGLLIFTVAILHLSELLSPETDSSVFWIVIPALIMANNRVMFEPYHTSDVVEGLDEFCLYLRPFDVKSNINFFARGKIVIPESIEKLIGETLNKRVAKFYCIGDPNAALPTTLSASCIYASDNEWKSVVANLTAKSKINILRIMNTDGCMWEMKHCITSCLDKTVFLADSDEGLMVLKDFLSDLDVDMPNIVIGNSSCLALFYVHSKSRWQLVDVRSQKDINYLISCFIDTHPELKEELAKKQDIGAMLTKPFKVKKINAIGVHLMIFFLQPLWYIIYNKWPKPWLYAVGIYVFIMCVLLFALLENIHIYIILLLLSFVLWMWLAPRITTTFNSWGSIQLTEKGNKVLLKWVCVYALLVILMSFLIEMFSL